ncbi:LRRK2 [Mytilus edulis]|uniref:LRRK2 n=1 Tax=Mytilus edulis TaxID=6550 RepID=A0A8S3QSW1_MYTED|nr:LRRK2 [Mytilus edulis]
MLGKTCLLRRLMNEEIDDVHTDRLILKEEKCLVNVKTGKWHFTTYCGFWDFAGQKEFYATHQTFLSANAVYLLVVDISKDFTTKTYNKMIEKEFDSIEEDTEKRKRGFKDYLNKDMSIQKKRGHLRKPHFLSNMVPSDSKQEFEELRNDMLCQARTLPNWEEHLPVRWIVLQKKFSRIKATKPCCTLRLKI